MDLPPIRTLAWTPALVRLGMVVVPSFERWCISPAVLPAEKIVASLVGFAPTTSPPAEHLEVVILLDGERAGGLPGPRPRSRFDNRYVQNIDLLPPPTFLLDRGLQRAVFLGKGPLAADLEPYSDRLRGGGMSVDVIEAG